MQGDHRAALVIYERLLESQPERIELLVNALSAAAGVHDREKTAALATRLLNLRPGHPAAGVALAEAALQREDFDGAIRLCSELTQTLPDSFDNWFNLGICYHRTGQFQSAVEAFERALEITAGDPDALEAKARAWSALERTGEALEAWDAVVRAVPERGEAWFHKGRLHYESGQWKDAAEAFEQCRERSAEHPVQVVLNLGLSRWKTGQLEAARDALELALVQDPENTAARRALVAIEIDSGDPSAALGRYLELGIHTHEITYNLALLCQEHGQLKEAAKLYREAIELNPRSGETRLNLGNVLFAMGDRSGAGRLWKDALDANPGLAARFMAVWD
jgi:tetratricopeptide (TPR) repeat protein